MSEGATLSYERATRELPYVVRGLRESYPQSHERATYGILRESYVPYFTRELPYLMKEQPYIIIELYPMLWES